MNTPFDQNQQDNTNAASKALRERFDVILPAGGRITGEFAQMAGVDIKALIAFEGKTILRRTIETLRKTGRIRRIVVIGPPAALDEARIAGADGLLTEGASGPDNILAGLKWVEQTTAQAEDSTPSAERDGTPSAAKEAGSKRVLIVTTDLPFLTAPTLTAFLDACPPDADVALPVMTQQAFEARFPGTQNEYVRLADGHFTMGCAFVLNPETLLRNEGHLRALFDARKSQWQMVRLIGIGTGLRFAAGRLSVAHLEARASRIARCKGRAILGMPPELAYDIDLPAEYLYAREHAALTVPTTVVKESVS